MTRAAPSTDETKAEGMTALPDFGGAAQPHRRSHEEIDEDRLTRLQPDPAAVRHARALLDAEPNADVAYIPMCLPGKQQGIWTYGQTVQTVPGVVVLGARDGQADGMTPPSRWARDMASRIAALHLDGRPGVAAWAVLRRGSDHTPVFEDPV